MRFSRQLSCLNAARAIVECVPKVLDAYPRAAVNLMRLAAEAGDMDLLRLLLSLMGYPAPTAPTPFWAAAEDLDEVLVDSDTDLETDEYQHIDGCGYDVIHYAAMGGHVQVAELLLQYAPDCLHTTGYRGITVAHSAVAGTASFIHFLHRAGVNLNVPSKSGSTPLFFAARDGSSDTVAALLNYVDHTTPGPEGRYAFQDVPYSSGDERFELLIRGIPADIVMQYLLDQGLCQRLCTHLLRATTFPFAHWDSLPAEHPELILVAPHVLCHGTDHDRAQLMRHLIPRHRLRLRLIARLLFKLGLSSDVMPIALAHVAASLS